MSALSGRPPFALRAVGPVALILLAALLAAGDGYGYHRDELYFVQAGRHPAFGYDDQPPLTPLVARLSGELLGESPWALRVLPSLAVVATVLIAAAIAREMGAGRRGQVIAALGASVGGAVTYGRLLSTATFDYLAWAVVLWLVVRILRGAPRREWLWVGLAGGVALQNKHLVLLLGAALAIGILVARRLDLARSPWPWAGLALAVAIAAPNIAWQAAHGWPQRTLAGQIADEEPTVNRLTLVPFQLLFAGLLVPIAIAGLVWLLRSPRAAPWRAIGFGYLALIALLLVTAGKGYYAAGFLPLLFGAGGAATEGWFSTRRRRGILAAGTVASAAVAATIAFAILPVDHLDGSPVAAANETAVESVGWPELVDQVAAVHRALPPDRRGGSVILAGNYGEAGALALLGPGRGLPDAVYAAQNAYWRFGRPSDGAAPVIAVGRGLGDLSGFLAGCRVVARIDNGHGVDNEEQGSPIAVCDGPRRPWSELWPELRFLSA